MHLVFLHLDIPRRGEGGILSEEKERGIGRKGWERVGLGGEKGGETVIRI